MDRAPEVVMTMSMVAKLVLVAVSGVLVLGTLLWFSFEREYGGQDQVRGVAVGLLADGGAEVREVPWGGDASQESLDYEVVDEGGVVSVRYLDHGGQVLFSGTGDEVAAWLDEQGQQLFVGAGYEEALQYRSDLQDSGKSSFPIWMIPIWFVPILTAIIAGRRQDASRAATPA